MDRSGSHAGLSYLLQRRRFDSRPAMNWLQLEPRIAESKDWSGFLPSTCILPLCSFELRLDPKSSWFVVRFVVSTLVALASALGDCSRSGPKCCVRIGG